MIAGPRIEAFHAVEINRRAHARARRGLPVIHMEVGQPSAGAPQAAIARAHEALDREPQGYWESGALRERIARHYAETQALAVDASQVVLTPGASSALLMAFAALFEPGDAVAMARPGYPAHRNVLKALGLRLVELDCGAATRFQPTAAMIAALDPAPAGLVLTSPSNPTGTVIEPAVLESIARVCRGRGIQLIADETYHGICYVEAPRTVAALDPDAIVVNTFSKYWCMTGWRLGWALVPPALVERMDRYAANLFLVPPTLAQHVALAAMDATDELEAHVQVYAANRRSLLEGLGALGIDRLAPADGAFYLYADVGHLTRDSRAFCLQLLDDTGLALNTGLDFDTVDGNRFLRLSFAVSPGEVARALALLADWLPGRALE